MKTQRFRKTATYTHPPKNIRVGNEVFRVSVVPNLEGTGGNSLWGCMAYDTREIHLHSTMSPGKALDIVFHELCHAWLWVYRNAANDFAEEDVAHATGRALSDIFIHNPALLEWVNKTAKQARKS